MHLIACHACDLINQVPRLTPGSTARCARCGGVLFRYKVDTVDRTIAWALAGLVLFCVATTFPFLAMKSGGIVQETGLLTGIRNLYGQEMPGLATLVLLTCVLVPLTQLLGLLYVFVPLKFNRRALYAAPVFRTFRHLAPWSMMEVFMLGILVALVKLGKMATIVPGLAVFAFALLMFALIAAVSAVDAHYVWERLEQRS